MDASLDELFALILPIVLCLDAFYLEAVFGHKSIQQAANRSSGMRLEFIIHSVEVELGDLRKGLGYFARIVPKTKSKSDV
jgi:hypothetical protein